MKMAKTCQACGGAVCEVCGGCIAHGECSCMEDQLQKLRAEVDKWRNMAGELYDSLARYPQTDAWVDSTLEQYREMLK
jgi:hypothetical protein